MIDRKLFENVIEDMKNIDKPYFKTGFTDLDDLLGLRKKGALVVIGARPAMGKTAFLLNILERVANQGKKCVLFSFEMSKEQVAQRLLCQVSETDLVKVRMGKMTNKDWDKFSESIEKIINWDFSISDINDDTIDKIEERIKTIKPEVVFIDYIQLIHVSKRLDRYTAIENIMKELKRIAKENEIIIFVNSQLSRGVENRCEKRPLLSDLRDSGSIENISDVVIFIYRDEYYHFIEEDSFLDGNAEIIVAKNKFGPTGVINLHFKKQITKFANIIRETEF